MLLLFLFPKKHTNHLKLDFEEDSFVWNQTASSKTQNVQFGKHKNKVMAFLEVKSVSAQEQLNEMLH